MPPRFTASILLSRLLTSDFSIAVVDYEEVRDSGREKTDDADTSEHESLR
jgi:hypothetical protein